MEEIGEEVDVKYRMSEFVGCCCEVRAENRCLTIKLNDSDRHLKEVLEQFKRTNESSRCFRERNSCLAILCDEQKIYIEKLEKQLRDIRDIVAVEVGFKVEQ